ncbi:unnamed protein product [Mytilus edulis]|uniref:Uncharacterized protein n=1 Tax=Mytilus edulis TaxID=6550 RepID=A0A8S3TZG4_MYTED|nr:unnamed protein product [Mytilus edulis]
MERKRKSSKLDKRKDVHRIGSKGKLKEEVAGINLTTESSPLLSISGPTRNCIIPITLGIKSMSRLQGYGNGHDQVRLSILFHDGNTCIKGIAFGDSARKWKDNLKVQCTYTLRSYDIKYSDRKYNNTKYEIRLLENTVLTKVKHGYFQIPKENKMQISELDHQFENLLVSTSKVMFIRIGRQIRPREKFLRELYIKDSTGQIKIKMWSLERDEFPYNVGDCVKLKYAYLKYDSFCRQWFLEKNDNMMIFKFIQPTYEVAGQTQEECLEEYPVFIKWIEENLPSQHLNTYFFPDQKAFTSFHSENGSYKTKSMSNIRSVQFDFKGTKTVNSQSLQKLAEKHSLTNGKWMLYGKTGNEIDQLWRSVSNGVIQGTIPTFCAKVSAARIENDNHVICIYNNNFLNERDIFA